MTANEAQRLLKGLVDKFIKDPVEIQRLTDIALDLNFLRSPVKYVLDCIYKSASSPLPPKDKDIADDLMHFFG